MNGVISSDTKTGTQQAMIQPNSQVEGSFKTNKLSYYFIHPFNGHLLTFYYAILTLNDPET